MVLGLERILAVCCLLGMQGSMLLGTEEFSTGANPKSLNP